MRSLEQWLDDQGQVHPQAIVLGLERLQPVLQSLGWKQSKVPVISVAGTNGKGSVSAYCTSILTAAGYRVGTFTSPHLREYRERIRIHDRLATPEELVDAFERIEVARGAVAPIPGNLRKMLTPRLAGSWSVSRRVLSWRKNSMASLIVVERNSMFGMMIFCSLRLMAAVP